MFLGVQLMVLAGIFTALSNYFLRKSIDGGGSSRAFLMIQLTITFLVAILLNPVRSGNFFFSPEIASLGLFAGIILGIMMICLGKSFEHGPAGLTVALLNASTVFPILGMVLFFGKEYGFEYTLWNAVGSLILVAGLFWAGTQTFKSGPMGRWLFFAISAFALHVVFLILLQWRFVLLTFPGKTALFSLLSAREAGSEWFMPMTFLSAALIQLVVYVRQESRVPAPQEVRFGFLGGTANGIGTFFMIWSTEVATSVEQAMIFPIFAGTVVLTCNLWGRFLYKEKVHWRATVLAITGLIIGTLHWKTLLH